MATTDGVYGTWQAYSNFTKRITKNSVSQVQDRAQLGASAAPLNFPAQAADGTPLPAGELWDADISLVANEPQELDLLALAYGPITKSFGSVAVFHATSKATAAGDDVAVGPSVVGGWPGPWGGGVVGGGAAGAYLPAGFIPGDYLPAGYLPGITGTSGVDGSGAETLYAGGAVLHAMPLAPIPVVAGASKITLDPGGHDVAVSLLIVGYASA